MEIAENAHTMAFMGFLDKAKDLLSKNADKVELAIDKAGDIVDKKTQGKYVGTVDKVQEAAKKAAAKNAGPTTPGPTTPSPTPPSQGDPKI
jgi:hypothetical protein